MNVSNEIKEWIEKATDSMEKSSQASWPNCPANHRTLRVDVGRKFIKLIAVDPRGGCSNVYAFLDNEGNIYKASTYKQPAKGIRSHISEKDPETITSSTGWLYR